MAKAAGRLCVIKKAATTIAGGRTVGITVNGSPINVEDQGNNGFQTLLADVITGRSLELTIDGYEDGQVLRDIALATTSTGQFLTDITFEFPNGDEISGDFSQYYRNFAAAWQLGPRQLAALQKLAEWREQRARARDKPRSWIVKDTALLAMAQAMVNSKAQLAQIPDVSDNFVRFEGEQVLALIDTARHLNEAACPSPLPKPLSQGQKNRLRKARVLVEAKAAARGGVKPIAKAKTSGPSARVRWSSAIDAKVAAGIPRAKAILAIEKEQPGLRTAMLAEVNAR
jgi:hypothetical protein